LTKNQHNKEFEVSNLDPNTEYNGTVYISLLQKSSKSQVFWVKTLAGEAVNSTNLKSIWDNGHIKETDFQLV